MRFRFEVASKEHALAHDATEGARLQVCEQENLAVLEFVSLVAALEATANRAEFAFACIDLEYVQATCIRVVGNFLNLCNTEVHSGRNVSCHKRLVLLRLGLLRFCFLDFFFDTREERLAFAKLFATLEDAPHEVVLVGELATDHGETFFALARDDRPEHAERETHGFSRNVKHRCEFVLGVRILREFPWSLDFEVAVHAADERHDFFDDLGELDLRNPFHHVRADAVCNRNHFVGGIVESVRSREYAAEVREHQAVDAVQDVTEVVGEVAVDAADKAFMCEVRVLTDDHFTSEEVAEGVDAVLFHVVHRVHDVTCGLTHLFASVHEPPAVGEDVLRERNVESHEHGRPIDAVGRQNVLTDEVVRGWPNRSAVSISLVEGGGGAHIVEERVKPDVSHVVRVKRQRNAPAEADLRTADAEVVQRLAEESADFVPAVVRHNPVLVAFQEVNQLLLVRTHLEEVVLFLEPFHRAVADRVALVFVEFVFAEEAFFADGVPAFVFLRVNFALVPELLQTFLHKSLVFRHRGADEEVVLDVHLLPEVFEAVVVFVHVFLRSHVTLGSGALHLLAVFVGTGQEKCLVADDLVEAGKDVSKNGRVGMPDMRGIIDVINRSGDVKIFHVRKFSKRRATRQSNLLL